MKRYLPLAVIILCPLGLMTYSLATASHGNRVVAQVEPRAVIYATEQCPPCHRLVADLRAKGWRVGPGGHFELRPAERGMLAPTVRVGREQIEGYDGTRAGLAAVIHLYRHGTGGMVVNHDSGSHGGGHPYWRDEPGQLAEIRGAEVQLVQYGGSAGSQSYYGAQGYYGAYAGGSGGGGGGFAPSQSYYPPQYGGYSMPYSGGSAGGGGFQPSYGYPQMMPPQPYYQMPQMQPHYHQGYGGRRVICGPNGCYVQ